MKLIIVLLPHPYWGDAASILVYADFIAAVSIWWPIQNLSDPCVPHMIYLSTSTNQHAVSIFHCHLPRPSPSIPTLHFKPFISLKVRIFNTKWCKFSSFLLAHGHAKLCLHLLMLYVLGGAILYDCVLLYMQLCTAILQNCLPADLQQLSHRYSSTIFPFLMSPHEFYKNLKNHISHWSFSP